jgi:hypothetical protein
MFSEKLLTKYKQYIVLYTTFIHKVWKVWINTINTLKTKLYFAIFILFSFVDKCKKYIIYQQIVDKFVNKSTLFFYIVKLLQEYVYNLILCV